MSYDKVVEFDLECGSLKNKFPFGEFYSLFRQFLIEADLPYQYIMQEVAHTNDGMIYNALDSITMKNLNSEGYKPKIKMRLCVDDKIFRFAIEDNGTGIDSEVEKQLFKQKISSEKKKHKHICSGGLGKHMLDSRYDIKELGGDIGFYNKGLNEGAIFWYEVPLQ
jgi:sensor histidine kinase regulating citrate/malate metabolism